MRVDTNGSSLHTHKTQVVEQRRKAAPYSIGIDLGGTNLRIGAFHAGSGRVGNVSIPTRLAQGPEAVLRDMRDAVLKLHSECCTGERFAGVGIGSPGPIQLPEGRLLQLPNFPGWDGLELRTELEQLTGLEVMVESDANAAALAEWYLGSGPAYQVDSLCMLTLGTGVGTGIILQGRIWHGDSGMGGEAGHTVVEENGVLCGCGTRGCLEMYASANAVRRIALEVAVAGAAPVIAQLAERQSGNLHADQIADLARHGDISAQNVFLGVGRHLGAGLAAVINVLNLPLYVLGGGLSQSWELFAPGMFEQLHLRSQIYRLSAPRDTGQFERRHSNVLPAILGPDAGLTGAALLPYFRD